MPDSLSQRLWNARHSLRVQLTLWMLVISLLLDLAAAMAIYFYQRSSMVWSCNTRLLQRIDVVATQTVNAGSAISDEQLKSFVDRSGWYPDAERAAATLYGSTGEVIASTIRPAPRLADVKDTPPEVKTKAVTAARQRVEGLKFEGDNDPTVRFSIDQLQTASGPPVSLLMAIPDQSYEESLRNIRLVFGLSTPIGLFAAGLAGWLVAGLATKPIENIRRLAGTLAPETLREEPIKVSSATSELTALQNDLRETRAKLLQAFEAQDRFVSSVSHELKTPIAVILTEAQTLRRDELPEEGRRFVLSVIEEMRRLGSTVESFLTLTKIRGGKTALNAIRRCGMNDAVMEALEGCNKMAQQYKVMLTAELADCETPVEVSGSSDLLRAMIDNLIRNAIRFSPEHRQVIVRVTCEDRSCIITVRDFGPGVAGEMLDTLFDRFAQARAEDQLGRGHGLGLSIAQGVAELHGGRIFVRNLENNGGCEFSVRLPLAEDEPSLRSPTTITSPAPATRTYAAPRTRQQVGASTDAPDAPSQSR